MNRERILAVADAIEKANHVALDEFIDNPDEYFSASGLYTITAFNMATWKCGTVGCIGGWVRSMYPPKTNPFVSLFNLVEQALDLNSVQTCELCTPLGDVIYSKITPAQAASVLRKLAETGKVDWSEVEKEQSALNMEI